MITRRWCQMKKILSNIFSNNGFRVAAGWLLLIIGIVLYYLGFVVFKEDEIPKAVCIKFADVFIIGVIIGYLTNAARFLGVFKQELTDVIFAKEFLSNRNDLTNIWINLSQLLFKEKFPAISKDLLSTVRENYFPINSVIYYNDLHIVHDISWQNKEKGIIKVVDSFDFDVITDSENNKIEIPMTTWIDVDGLKNDDYSVQMDVFNVNSENKLTELTCSEQVENGLYKHHCATTVNGRKKYEIEQKRTKTYSIIKDYDISYRARIIINKLRVELKFPDDIDVNFLPRGTIQDYHIDKSNNKGICSMTCRYRSIILPRQGYVFILNVKQ